MGKIKVLCPREDKNKLRTAMKNSALSKKRSTDNQSHLKKKAAVKMAFTESSLQDEVLFVKKNKSHPMSSKYNAKKKDTKVVESSGSLFTVRDEISVGSLSSEISLPKVNQKTKRIVPIVENVGRKKIRKNSDDDLSENRKMIPKFVDNAKESKKLKKTKSSISDDSPEKPVIEDKDCDGSKAGLNRNSLFLAVNAVFQLFENDSKNKLLDSSAPIYIQLNTIKAVVPPKKVIRFMVPHSLSTDTSDVCLIVKDYFKDRERSIELMKERLKTSGITCINEIIPLKTLDVDYNQYEDRRKLSDRFDFFLVDSTVIHRCVKKLGKPFYTKRKLPVPVRLGSNRNLKVEIEKSLSKVTAVIERATTTICFKVGHTSMMPEQVRDNVMSVWSNLDRLVPGGCSNVKLANLKLSESQGVPFHGSMKFPSQVHMDSDKLIWKKNNVSKTPIVGEITTQPEATVLVYPSGSIVVKGEVTKDNVKKLSKAEQKEKEKEMKKKSGKNETTEESSDDETDIKDFENEYLIELGKSKGLKQLAKEEAKKVKTKKEDAKKVKKVKTKKEDAMKVKKEKSAKDTKKVKKEKPAEEYADEEDTDEEEADEEDTDEEEADEEEADEEENSDEEEADEEENSDEDVDMEEEIEDEGEEEDDECEEDEGEFPEDSDAEQEQDDDDSDSDDEETAQKIKQLKSNRQHAKNKNLVKLTKK